VGGNNHNARARFFADCADVCETKQRVEERGLSRRHAPYDRQAVSVYQPTLRVQNTFSEQLNTAPRTTLLLSNSLLKMINERDYAA
jgi:hypothetical protein